MSSVLWAALREFSPTHRSEVKQAGAARRLVVRATLPAAQLELGKRARLQLARAEQR
jgi:hypothetical protein